MKFIIVSVLTICCLSLSSCEDNSTDSEYREINRCGFVDQAGAVTDGTNYYVFERGGDAFSHSFHLTDHVCFEARVLRDNTNSQGGMTYWCELISMRGA